MAQLTLGSVVRRLRAAGGLTQRELAARLGIDATYVSHLEANRREPSVKLLRQIAAELSIPAGLLLALIISDDLPEGEGERFQPLLAGMVDLALTAQLRLPISGLDDEEPSMA
ncbi:MAG: helix-turn-helix transcriptional regulator [Gemmatimonadota bacterium]